MLCAGARFQKWLRGYAKANAEDTSGDIVRALLGVDSRAEIDTNGAVRELWRCIVQQYETDTGLAAQPR
jgi:hypothetical protein